MGLKTFIKTSFFSIKLGETPSINSRPPPKEGGDSELEEPQKGGKR